MSGFADRTVIVTGAAGGIGSRITAQLVAQGARVVGFDRAESGDHLDGIAAYHVVDLTDRAAVHATVAAVQARFGGIDVLVNNAGGSKAETLDELDEAGWTYDIALNLNGVHNVTSAVLPHMLAARTGAIVSVSTVNALMHFGNPAYAAAKAGVIAYMKAIAVEYGPRGIRANVVCPGSVRTPAWKRRIDADPTIMDRLLPYYPLGRLVEPDEVAAAVVFLASPLASGITGTVLPVDAGLMAGNKPMTEVIVSRRF